MSEEMSKDWREQEELKKLKEYLVKDFDKAIDSFVKLSNKAKMIKLTEELIEIGEQILDDVNDERKGKIIGTLGNLCYNLGKFKEAEKYYEEALKFYIKLAKKDESYMKYVAGVLNNLGNLYYATGKPTEAEKAFRDALIIRQDINDKEGLATTLSCLGLLYSSIADYEKAKEYYERALLIRMELHKNDVKSLYNLGMVLNNLGTIYNALNDTEKAEESYKKAIETYKDLLSREERVEDMLCGAMNNLASLYLEVGKTEEAEELLNEIKKYESLLPPDLKVKVIFNNARIIEKKDVEKAAKEYLRAGSMAFVLFVTYGMKTINFIYCFEKVEEIGEGEIKGDAEIMRRAMLKAYFGLEKDKEIKRVECSKRGKAILDALKGSFKLEVKDDIDLAAYIIANEIKKKSGF